MHYPLTVLHSRLLAGDPGVRNNTNGLPGLDTVRQIVGAMLNFGLVACVAALVASAVDALGEQASVSRSTVSRICAQIKTEFEAWSRRPLDDVTLSTARKQGKSAFGVLRMLHAGNPWMLVTA